MAGALSETEGPPRTPPVVWILALLVVGAVWFFWSGSRREQESDFERWHGTPLAPEEVEEVLESPSPERDRLGHALTQLRVHAAADALSAPDLKDLVPHVARHAKHAEAQMRLLAAAAATMIPCDDSVALLREMLDDEDGKVAINAAIGLARFEDPAGADLLEEAIRGTRMEQIGVRRNFLHAFRRVAQKRHLEFLRAELHRAELDEDAEAAAYCREALERLE